MPELREPASPTPPIEIKTPGGLVLRQYTLDDTQEAFDLIDRNRDHLSQFGDTTAEKYKNVETMKESIENPKNPKRLRFSIRSNEGKLVGSINLTPDEDNSTRGEVGYYLGKEFTGKHYTQDALLALTDFAFQSLDYQELYAKVDPDNEASKKVLLNAGFVEGETIERDTFFVRRKSSH